MGTPMTNGQPTGVRPLPDLAGRIAFLGTCDNAAHVLDRAGVPVVNILGLKLEVVSCVYPLPLNKFSFCVAFRDAASLPKLRIALKDRNDVQLLGFDVSFESKDRATVTPGDVHLRGYLPVSSSWMVAILRPEELKKNVLSLMSEPGVLRVTAISEGFSEEIGSLNFSYEKALPLTQERIAAIRSQPQASRFIRFVMKCQTCGDGITPYAALERNSKMESEGHHWYSDVPDFFTCKCGKKIDLKYVRESLHGLLGQPTGIFEEEASFGQLYTVESLAATVQRFQVFLDESPEEPEVQQFLGANPIFWTVLAPELILEKAPVLHKYQTDFAILSKTGTLYLVEIEKPEKKLLKKDGAPTQLFHHPFHQVTDWLREFDKNRPACIDGMKLKPESVSAVKGVVIIGRDKGYDPDALVIHHY